MPSIRNIHYLNWGEFKNQIIDELFQGNPFYRGKYLFRGQRDDNWNLVTSFDRWFEQMHDRFSFTNKIDKFSTSNTLIEYFFQENDKFSKEQVIGNDDKMLQALGQHYGLPTRLLDWTESPYIAAFFAYNGAYMKGYDSGNAAIWVLCMESKVWSPNTGVECFTVPKGNNLRLRNQEGWFTLSKTPFESLEEYVNNFDDLNEPALIKIHLPLSDSLGALADLDSMGINYSKVYPEIEGLVKSSIFKTMQDLQHN